MDKVCTYDKIEMTLDEFKAVVEANRTDAFYIAGLAAVALCNYKRDRELAFQMLNALRNPVEPMPERDIYTIRERLTGKEYIPYSYFAGAIQFNNFTPRAPYTILVKDNQFSFYEDCWAELWLKSSGDTKERQVRLRKRPSTGAWYLTEQMLVQDINLYVEETEDEDIIDPWG